VPDKLLLQPQHLASDSSLSSSARFAQRVEQRNLKSALVNLRRASTCLSKAQAALAPWQDRLRKHRGKQSPPALQDVAKRTGTILEKARLCLLSGSRELKPLLRLLEQVAELLLQFGSGVCLNGLFSQSIDSLTKFEALDLTEQSVAQIQECLACAKTTTSICNQRLQELAATKSQRAEKSPPKPEPEATEGINNFLTQLQGKGWKVAERRKEDEVSEGPDALARSHDLVKQISGSYSSLLPDDVDYGLCRFPIVLVREGKLSDAVKTVLAASHLGYEVLTVYGRYTAINGLFLIGIHRSLLNMVDQEMPRSQGCKPNSDPYAIVSPRNASGTRLDLGKFHSFLPAITENNQQFSTLFKETTPVGNPVRTGKHYYLPLLPNRLAGIPNFSLGEWQPLLQHVH
jgi:hypothetical protein